MELYYKQVKGTAMGTKCTTTYTTLLLFYLNEKLYNIIEGTCDKEFREYFFKKCCVGIYMIALS